jgi:hypothetical protein
MDKLTLRLDICSTTAGSKLTSVSFSTLDQSAKHAAQILISQILQKVIITRIDICFFDAFQIYW